MPHLLKTIRYPLGPGVFLSAISGDAAPKGQLPEVEPSAQAASEPLYENDG